MAHRPDELTNRRQTLTAQQSLLRRFEFARTLCHEFLQVLLMFFQLRLCSPRLRDVDDDGLGRAPTSPFEATH